MSAGAHAPESRASAAEDRRACGCDRRVGRGHRRHLNAYRSGTVDTSIEEGIRSGSPEEVGALHERFTEMHTSGSPIEAAASAAALLDRLPGCESGDIWILGE